jgi:pimeloyl-ACP methyl ester carboxylesterase
VISLTIILVIGFISSKLLAKYVVKKHPPIGKFINVPYHGKDISLHYIDNRDCDSLEVDSDDRPVLILIHGATGNLHDFKSSIYDSLAEKYRVIAFDRPGLGYSERPNYAASQNWCNPREQMELLRSAILALGINKPFILGHSLAGPIVLDYLLEHGEEMSGAIMLSPVSHPWPNGVTWYNYLDMFPIVKQILAYTWLPIFGFFNVNSGLNVLFYPEITPNNYRQKTALDLFFRSKVMLDNFRDQRLLCEYVAIAGRRYRQISSPIQVISGNSDDVVTTWLHSEKLSYELQNVEWENIPNLGHSPHHSQPQKVVDIVNKFIATIVKN